MDRENFRKYGYQFVDWVADYMENLEDRPVAPPVKPGEIREKLPREAPLQPESMDRIFTDFERIILPGMTHWQHPSWFAYFPAHNSPPSILAELLTAGMGAVCLLWKTSPAAVELEETVMEWLRRLLDLPDGMSGVIQDSASAASLAALLTAREKATGFESNRRGLREPLIVYTSREAHSSIEKGAKIAGYGRDHIRFIETDSSFAMRPEKLEDAVRADREQGLRPAFVSATVGTTSSSAIDPLGPIGDICRRYNLWMHVDAAYAGTAGLLPEKRWILDGVEHADSFVFNPHKWMLTNFDCSAYFVKDESSLVRTFEIHPEYLKTREDDRVRNFRDWGIPLGRRFRALKLWFVLRSYGVEGIRAMIREHIRQAGLFRDWVKHDKRFELMAPVPLSLVCFRINDGRDERALDDLNRIFLERVNSAGSVLLTHTTLGGRYVLRMSIGSRTTEERHVRAAWDLLTGVAGDLLQA